MLRKIAYKIYNLLVCKTKIKGEGNKFILVDKEGRERFFKGRIKGLLIEVFGNNNTIKIDSNTVFYDSKIHIGRCNNCLIEIKKCSLKKMIIRCWNSDNVVICIGEGTTNYNNLKIEAGETNAGVLIGKDCMLSENIVFRATDGHGIYDCETGKIINKISNKIVIGDHCWISRDVKFGKEATISNNTIVGMGAVVTKEFTEENTILAGNPAKVIRRGVNWTREQPHLYKEQVNKESL